MNEQYLLSTPTRFPMTRLILASGSPRRIQLLREASFAPEVVRPEVAEVTLRRLPYSERTSAVQCQAESGRCRGPFS